jgi:sugar lactone lactonase YvrE
LRGDDIYTLAGNGSHHPLGAGGHAWDVGLEGPAQVAVDRSGNVLIADGPDDSIGVVAARDGTFYGGYRMTTGDIYKVAGDGFGVGALGVAVDSAGNIVMLDGSTMLRVYAVNSGTFYGQPMTAGDIYDIAGNGQFNSLGATSGDGGPADGAQFGLPTGMAVDADGNLAIVDRASSVVRLVAGSSGTFYGQAMKAGDMYTIADDARLFGLYGIAFDPAGNLVMTTGNFAGVYVLAAHSGTFYGQAMSAGQTYLIGGLGTGTGDGIPATAADLAYVSGVTVDADGNILISDTPGSATNPDDRIRCIAGSSATFYGQPMIDGDIYTLAGNGNGGFSGDGGPAVSAGINPAGLALDAHGNIIVADHGNFRIRVVATAAGTFYGQQMTAGDIYTIAGDGTNANNGDGGPATSAAVSGPWDQAVAVDRSGNVIVTVNGQVRVIAVAPGTFYGIPMTAGNIYTVAGNGQTGYSGDGGPATQAEFAEINSVALGPEGNILIGDMLRIRSVSP